MARTSSAGYGQVAKKLNELLNSVRQLSPEEVGGLTDKRKAALAELIEPARTDMSKWKKEVNAFLESRGPAVERSKEPQLSDVQIKLQVEIYQTILKKWGISEEVTQLAELEPKDK